MRVISSGPTQYRTEVTCLECASKLEVTEADVTSTYEKQADGAYGYYIRCPLCMHRHPLESEGIPKLVRRAADRRTTRGGFKD